MARRAYTTLNKETDTETKKGLYKTEGTSISYGQSYSIVKDENASSLTSQAKEGSTNNTKNISVSNTVSNERGRKFLSSIVFSKKDSSEFQTSEASSMVLGKPAVAEKSNIAIKETVVRLFSQVSKPSDILGCKAKSDIAVAAASPNDNASVVVKPDLLGLTSLDGVSTLSLLKPNPSGFAIVEGSQIKTKDEVKESLQEAAKIDLSITLKSKQSESVELNTIKVPTLAARFVYNFFIEEEVEIETQEDPGNDPLFTERPINVPRYVELQWSISEVTDPLTGTEEIVKKNRDLRQKVFSAPRGSVTNKSNNTSKSYKNKKKNYIPYIFKGVNRDVPDIHMPEVTVNSILNRKMYNNTVKVVLNSENKTNNISELPFKNFLSKFVDGE